ncbi:endoplasmic reticulum aminopeptidase 1-like [Oppia nitens]|uniref:endoplasmic reticulum aminopeptidase 1-like n=1 Tax=Oppia nitens TaxID=1686743 RepID=UPI0023DB36AE|nr:endoplasmic reticulum aminopeptidase 1-like [Oppia nitens]
MKPNMTTFYNTGSVSIWLTVTERTDFVVIHTKKLNITDITMTSADDMDVPVIRRLECTQHEQLFIGFDGLLVPNRNYSLRLTFERQLEEQLEGFYVSSYVDTRTGVRKYLLTTHFEPTSARSAFPCFDEPALKASFSMKLVHERDFEAFFNSERVDRVPYNKEGLIMSVFEPTVPMSTYLVAFIVCDFNIHAKQTREGINIRAIVPDEQDSQSNYALNSAASILSYYQEFFNITYPLSKLDLVAVPDFGGGAMENWGLITFRTSVFLYNDNESNSETQEQVAIVVAHELAHMWFGNLVTMNWWDDLWLNEGFASYIENLGVNYIHPEWKMMEQFVVTTTQYAMAMDSLQTSHPIRADVKNPTEIEAIFDMISYKKGASLIRMLDNFLGIDNLRIGLSAFLHKYQYKTAKTSDLWHSFSDASRIHGINVSAIMDTWVNQKGFPVITVRRIGNQLMLNQRRFLSSIPDSDNIDDPSDISPFGYKWIIPVTIITDRLSRESRLVWFNTSTCRYHLMPNTSGSK